MSEIKDKNDCEACNQCDQYMDDEQFSDEQIFAMHPVLKKYLQDKENKQSNNK